MENWVLSPATHESPQMTLILNEPQIFFYEKLLAFQGYQSSIGYLDVSVPGQETFYRANKFLIVGNEWDCSLSTKKLIYVNTYYFQRSNLNGKYFLTSSSLFSILMSKLCCWVNSCGIWKLHCSGWVGGLGIIWDWRKLKVVPPEVFWGIGVVGKGYE